MPKNISHSFLLNEVIWHSDELFEFKKIYIACVKNIVKICFRGWAQKLHCFCSNKYISNNKVGPDLIKECSELLRPLTCKWSGKKKRFFVFIFEAIIKFFKFVLWNFNKNYFFEQITFFLFLNGYAHTCFLHTIFFISVYFFCCKKACDGIILFWSLKMVESQNYFFLNIIFHP